MSEYEFQPMFLKVTEEARPGYLAKKTYYIPAQSIRYVYEIYGSKTVLVLEDGTEIKTTDCKPEDVVQNVLCGEIIPLTEARL